MAIDMIEDNELSALAPMRQSVFMDDNIGDVFSRLGYARQGETEFNNFMQIGEGNRRKGKVIKAKNPVKNFPFNEKMSCVKLADIAEKVNAEIDAATLESGGGSAYLKRQYADYLGRLKRHKNSIDALMRSKKCEDQTSNSETQKIISENAAAIQAAQMASTIPETTSGKGNTMLYVLGGIAVLGLVGFMILRKKQ
jgi:hypothetical protein